MKSIAVITLATLAIIHPSAAIRAEPNAAAPRLDDSLKDLNGKVVKLFDEPIRDPSVCRGPDGAYYLTGTSEPFWGFNNENGIRVWKSLDLVKWEPLGTVWRYGGSPWHKPYLEAKKPLWAPEIHYLKGTFWLTYSMPGWQQGDHFENCGSGLLKSTTGKPEGPYADVSPTERLGDEIDASLFEDDDGSVYFLWHRGMIRKLKPDLSGPAEPMRKLTLSVPDPDPGHHTGLCAMVHGRDSFDHIGYEGVFLLKIGDTYVLSGSDQFEGKYTCWIATSKSIYGPYGARYPAIPFGGHNMFFKDQDSNWWSTIFNGPINERPCILPVDIRSNGQVSLRATTTTTPVPAKRDNPR
jgi:beta-xylosidase